MASWHNNFTCPPPSFPVHSDSNSFKCSIQPSQSPVPPPPGPPPFFGSSQAVHYGPPESRAVTPQLLSFPPPPPMQLCMVPPFQHFAPPPMCNIGVPPPVISVPPPNVSCKIFIDKSGSIEEPDEKFEHLKQLMEEKYNKMAIIKEPAAKMKISDIKNGLVKCFGYLEQLESLMNCLQITFKSLPENEWSGHCKEAEKVKSELSTLMKDICNPVSLQNMKKIVQMKKKKRDYKKRKQKEWRDEKRISKIHAEQENRRIDLWLEKMKDQVARAKREEDIKREADIVLSDVTSKKAEAKRMLNMLNSLAKLRSARAHNLSSGKSFSDHDNNAFNEVIDRLKKMWLDQFNDYKVEEEGLKVMLGHAEEERISIEAAQLRKNLKAWSEGIFGTSASSKGPTVEELISTRLDWDKFICSDDAPMASSIPVGWVLPCEPSSKEWEKFL